MKSSSPKNPRTHFNVSLRVLANYRTSDTQFITPSYAINPTGNESPSSYSENHRYERYQSVTHTVASLVGPPRRYDCRFRAENAKVCSTAFPLLNSKRKLLRLWNCYYIKATHETGQIGQRLKLRLTAAADRNSLQMQSWCANRWWADVFWQPVYSSCAKACYYHLRRIRQIRKYVDDEAIRSLVHAFVQSRSRLTTTVTVSMPLQCVYSSEAPTCTKLCSTSIVADALRRGSSRPLLQQLHWLPG